MHSNETTGEVKEHMRAPRMDAEHTEAALNERLRLATLIRDISIALIQNTTLPESLQQCAQALVDHLEAAFARIWTLDKETQILEIQASAGMYTHLNGAHSRVPVGSLKIGLIAAERLPHLTNEVVGDPRVGDQEWAKREKMVAFAGYPLLIEGEVVGVMALFARVPLSPAVLDAMASVSNAIALGIEHKRVEEERDRLLRIAEHARIEAEAALEVRNNFLSSVSHDLKTPITVMQANIQMLQRRIKRGDIADMPAFAQRLTVIETSIIKMTGMVEDLLGIARLQTGQMVELDLRPLQVGILVRQVCTEQQETTKRHQIELVMPAEDVIIQADRVRLDRALTNLLTNAIKYSPQGGFIKVEVTQEKEVDREWIIISIRDQGVGIPAADLPHIFKPFHRASNVEGRIAGTGIGLASVTQVITEHGGTISAKSEEGEGSTFTVWLPCFINEAVIS